MSKNKTLWPVSLGNGNRAKMTYDEYVAHKWWFTRRVYWEYIWKYRCAICNAKCEMRIHHRIYIRLGQEWVTDAIAMCPICHHIFHKHSSIRRSLEVLNPIDAEAVAPMDKHFLSTWGNRCAVCNSQDDVDVHWRSIFRKPVPVNTDALALCFECNDLFIEHGRII